MRANDQIAAARSRRIAAEADEIALRAAQHRGRCRGVPIYDAHGYPTLKSGGGDMLRIHGVPEAGPGHRAGDMEAVVFDDDDRQPIAWGVVFLWLAIALVLLIGFVLGWLIGSIGSWTDARDFIAPTAAQARDLGWIALSEWR